MWYAAIVWMCRNQLGRRNVTDEQKTVLIGEAYKAQKMSVGNHAERGADGRYLSRHSDDKGSEKTKDIIAKKFNVGGSTVERAERFLDGLNEAEKVFNEFSTPFFTPYSFYRVLRYFTLKPAKY